ncbi:unnamed protein product [Rotaria sordida]|uniref:Uncharacterized protein n=2 Tax=Rotaria sordida TaxID=392033 RepID=A0A814L9D8_9BILA|nr:unnamed protein product [Rotaria sordida]
MEQMKRPLSSIIHDNKKQKKEEIYITNDVTYADNKRWERLILSHMPNLRVFDIRHEDWPKHANNNQLVLDTQINPFTSSFWIERQWFFEHQCYHLRYTDCTIFYSINPYRRKNYVLYEQSMETTCLNSDKTNLKASQYWQQKLYKLNLLETLVNDYISKQVGSKLYLWW